MRKTIALATFVALGAGTTAAGALSGITNFKGSDTLFTITRDLIDDAPVLSLTYIGTGSSNGQNALTAASPTQTTAPMSRAVNASVCAAAGTTAEGVVFALDALSIVVADAIATSCSADAGGNCAVNQSGIAFSNAKTFPVSDLNGVAGIQCKRTSATAPGCTGGDASATYTVQSFRDVLRILAAGMPVGLGTTAAELAKRDCNSDLRHSLASSYSNLFQTSCTTGTCGALQHFFVRDPFSGTTDVFLSLLQLPSLALENPVANNPFCYTRLPADDWAAPAGPPRTVPPYYTEYQDNDPVRRACVGTNNNVFSASDPALPPANEPAEQVCGAMGTLGLVLPINPQPGVPQADAYPSTPCSTGKFAVKKGPYKSSFESDVCPNGDKPIGGQNCFTPVTTALSTKCLNGKNNLPGVKLVPAQANATDGRVYNLHLRQDTNDTNGYRVAKRINPDGVEDGGTIDAYEVGAFYRIHTTRSLIAANPSSGTCLQDDATQQIACLTQASPCSAGYAGREGPSLQAGASGVRVGGIPGDLDSCVQALVSGGTTYPLSRKLYFNTLAGFENVTGAELDLAKRFSGITAAKVTANGFVPMPAGPICEDFNEATCAGATVANVNACATNPTDVVTGAAYCGNGTVELPEVCDDGVFGSGPCNNGCTGP